MEIDFGRTAGDYGRHRAGFPPALFERLSSAGLDVRGRHVLDVGTGTGSLARGLARLGGRVVGLDRAPAMLRRARELDAAGERRAYVASDAQATGFRDGAFDLISAGQCWHWFDPARVTAEVRRLLRPGGRVLVCSYDWLPLPGGAVAATEDLIRRHNPTWSLHGGDGRHPEYAADLGRAGFEVLAALELDVDEVYSHEAWRGRIRASAGVGASLPTEGIAAFDAELSELLAARFPEDPLSLPHRAFAVVARRPS